MKGIELSEAFYNEYGIGLCEQFSHIEKEFAVGLAGSGSECFGYDDEISEDHDFEPGFCIFVSDALDSRTEFALERAYAKLPKEFMGYKRSPLSPVGGNRHGVIRMSDFFRDKTGSPDGELTLYDWLSVPEQSLAEATNGKIYRDVGGELGRIRKRLEYMPEDVRLKKLAGNLVLMGQTGQYNYGRCMARGDLAAAQLSVNEFVNHSLHAIFLLNRKYMPYYKWTFRALKDLPVLSELYPLLEGLLCNTVDKESTVEQVCQKITDELISRDITSYRGTEAEGHAYSVNNRIQNEKLRNLHIMSGV